MCVALLIGPCVLEVGCKITRSAGYKIITEPTYNSHATPKQLQKKIDIREGKI